VPAQQSKRLHDALQAAGASATLELVAGYNHMFAGMPDVQLEALLERTTTFLLDRASPRPGSHLDEGADA